MTHDPTKPFPDPGAPASVLARVCRAAMWLFAAAFTVCFPIYALYVLLTPLPQGDVGALDWKAVVAVLLFVYWIVVRLRVYTRPEAPPRRVIVEHHNDRRWF